MFKWLKKTSKKVDDTLDQAKNDLSETSEKVQKVLDESSNSVKTTVKILTISLGVSIIANIINIAVSISKYRSRKTSGIVIQNLYLGAK